MQVFVPVADDQFYGGFILDQLDMPNVGRNSALQAHGSCLYPERGIHDFAKLKARVSALESSPSRVEPQEANSGGLHRRQWTSTQD